MSKSGELVILGYSKLSKISISANGQCQKQIVILRVWTQHSSISAQNWPKLQFKKDCLDLSNCTTYLVSTRDWRSSDNWRNRKNVRIERRARSTSPHGSLFVKSMPVSGVTVGGKSRDASDITISTRGGFRVTALYSSSNMSRNISSLWKKGQKVEI